MKVLALAIAQERNLRRAENNQAVVNFFSKLVGAGDSSALEQTAAERGWPKHLMAIKHAETILKAIDTNIKHNTLHPEEFLSLLDAQLEISNLKSTLAKRDEELLEAKLQVAAMLKQIANSNNQDVIKLKSELASTQKELSDAKEQILLLSNQAEMVKLIFVNVVLIAPYQPAKTQDFTKSSNLVSGILGQFRKSSSVFGSHIQDPVTQNQNSVTVLSPPVPKTLTSYQASSTAETMSKEITEYSGLPDDPSASLQACGEWFKSSETYDFFISYRVATDAKVAMELYFRLKDQRILDEYGHSRQVKVYWDKECLKKGQDWRDGFVQGLKNSRCVLMIMSPGAAERMKVSDVKGDNVLLEWETAILAGKKSICIPQPGTNTL
ncbi:hypothetical protein BCR33DRAFT_283265 [Rhizoclosmatium globosum]|uniref:TIR domain-containing protein n=1 Tax=Rhizoclosmatium globosum TaxID=329046 RepID=A0A1Y2C734_9FUNG|nr:hypothetical protein BCR33DRAFT_283265 [Rhizoclosmatium globosum]|eukprot:ORY42842.1 hypothetical protein BCR33DRAFT_283265 [Rhizoclosmatium globosum]